MQSFAVNSLNQLSGSSRSGTFTVAGTTTTPATNVTVNSSNALRYADRTFASTNHTLANGTNTFTAIAWDTNSRIDTNIVVAYLPESSVFVYDSNGNMVFDGQKAFEYDDENQLSRITVTNYWKSEFTYDGKMRRRIRKEYTWRSSAWALTNEVRYTYGGNLVIQERDPNNLAQVTYTRGKDLSGTLEDASGLQGRVQNDLGLVTYIRGSDGSDDIEDAGGIGGLLARTDNAQLTIGDEKTHSYYHADGNGNIAMLINMQSVAIAKYLYDPFGTVLSKNGPLAEANLYRFSSKEQHAPSGLISYPYRYYDANAQKWINRDPIGEDGGLNLYAFVRNNPINYIDPEGLDCPGCDNVPDGAEDACTLEACAQHDKCYDDNNCTAQSWFKGSKACKKCNKDVVISIAKCKISGKNKDNPNKPNFYCAKQGKFISIPGDFPNRKCAEKACCN